MNEWFGKLQKIGKALMLPVAVLPAAALLLRFGAPDVLNIPFVFKAGAAVFDNLALLFAIGIAVGLAHDNGGAAGLAGAIGYFVLTNGVKTINPELNMSVLAGIISGITAGVIYNKYYNIKLPEFLAFFGGRRFCTYCYRCGLHCTGCHLWLHHLGPSSGRHSRCWRMDHRRRRFRRICLRFFQPSTHSFRTPSHLK